METEDGEWAGATCTKLFSGHLRQYHDLRDDTTKFLQKQI